MKKFFIIVSMVIFSIICSLFISNCGLEDIANINAVTDIDFYGTDDNFVAANNNLEHVFYNVTDGWVRFKADNREYERKNAQEFYLIVGYDIYYSVSSGSSFKKANVFDPFLTVDGDGYHDANKTLYDVRGESFPDGSSRFPSKFFNSDYDDFYTKTTFPIMLSMVPYLNDTDYNVQFCFFDSSLNDATGDKNPFIYNNSVRLDNVYPNFDEYEASWYKKMRDDGVEFKGFYDYRYYKKKGITPYDTSGSSNVYKMWFYVIAKGFNSADDVDRISNYNESVKSATKECYFLVDTNVDTSYVD